MLPNIKAEQISETANSTTVQPRESAAKLGCW